MITKNDKLRKLKEISDKLKTEFVGISDVIDSLIDSITPWYITPELLERPVVVSLWGLTGTGKTSVVRKLIEYLDVQNKALFFDCGAEENTDSSISDKITGFFDSAGNGSVLDTEFHDKQELNGVFVFDEFQYSRTINEDGCEVSKCSQRSIWNLLDSGILDIIQRPYEIKELMTFSDELDYLVSEFGRDLKITKGCWPESVQNRVKETIDFVRTWDDVEDDKETQESKDKPILRQGKKETLVGRLNYIERGLGYKVIKSLDDSKTLGEFSDILREQVKVLSKPKSLDCSKSLVFIIGNLDEAFTSHSDLDPDMDADVFAKITRKTCISDIKEALKRRFRVEQIGRLGSNLLIYPSLGKSDFKEIIKKELSRVLGKFKETSGIDVSVTEKFEDLLYSEGVTPSQGVRPLLSTIGTVCLTKLSKILSDPRPKKTASMDVIGNLRTPEVTVRITYDTSEVLDIKETLKIGFLRSKGSCKKIAAHAVHEAGHAVMITWTKREIPEMILAQSSLGGGYTYENLDKEDRESALSKYEVDSKCMIGLAGICSEHLFFDDSHCTIGCSQDYKDTWEDISDAAYTGSFFGTSYPYWCPDSPHGIPDGASDASGKDSWIVGKMKEYLDTKYSETTEVLKKNKELIRRISLYLVDNYCMMPEVYTEYLEKYGSQELLGRYHEGPIDSYWLEEIKKEA